MSAPTTREEREAAACGHAISGEGAVGPRSWSRIVGARRAWSSAPRWLLVADAFAEEQV